MRILGAGFEVGVLGGKEGFLCEGFGFFFEAELFGAAAQFAVVGERRVVFEQLFAQLVGFLVSAFVGEDAGGERADAGVFGAVFEGGEGVRAGFFGQVQAQEQMVQRAVSGFAVALDLVRDANELAAENGVFGLECHGVGAADVDGSVPVG